MDPLSRVGLELELLAPHGVTRSVLADWLADRSEGHVEYGFKYHSENERADDGRIKFRLADAARVVDADGRVLVTVVPDNTLRGGLPTEPHAWVMNTDDLRLALWVEGHCWSREPDPFARLEALRSTFDGRRIDDTIADQYGHSLVEPDNEPFSWRRICEFVTRPLMREERADLLELLLICASAHGLTVPKTAALHVHYDAAPWQHIETLRRLLLESDAHFDAWRAQLKPNVNCLRLGRQPRDVIRVAREYSGPTSDDAFFTFGAGLSLAGAEKSADLNVLGVIQRYPKQPTLELRALPMSLELDGVLGSLDAAERLLLPFVHSG